MVKQRFLKGFGFSNQSGSRFLLLLRLYRKYGVAKRYRTRAFLNAILAFVLSFFALLDRLVWFLVKRKVGYVADPLFIIGHWRSGTTLLHDLLCLDERAGYTTTFQTVFPNNLFGFNKPLVWIMGRLMPAHRPVDKVPLNPHRPQEEEFGLGNITELCYYMWWYFPDAWPDILEKYLTLDRLSTQDLARWKKTYKTFIARALLYQHKHWLVSKNPPNTARIKHLLDMYPDARFIYLTRNPYEVYVSSQRFFKAILEPLQLQEIDEETFKQNILDAYCLLYDNYQKTKSLIPKNRLVEISYEQFIADEVRYLRSIYAQLEMKLHASTVDKWQYAISINKHAPNKYNFTRETIYEVNKALGNRIEEMGYERLS